jgi:filamentous hemagglutinin
MRREGEQLSVGVGSGSASINMGSTEGSLDYANVSEQSGIYVKDKLTGKVKGETELVGSVISAGEGSTFETERIITQDISNHMNASAESSNTGFDTGTATNGKYGTAMTVIGNTMNDGLETDSDSGKTSSAISSNIVITTTSNQDLSTLNRDTSNTNDQVRMGDLDGLAQDADEEARAGKTAYEVTKVGLDKAKQAIFDRREESKIMVKQKDANGNIIKDKDGRPVLRELTEEEKKLGLKVSDKDGKVHVSTNGIFNDVNGAGQYAYQHDEEDMYVAVYPKADGFMAELFVAFYQKYMEGDLLGLSTTTELIKDLLGQYGESGLVLNGHSRGSLTITNAMNSYLKERGYGSAPGLQVNFFGAAQNVYNADQTLADLQGRDSWAPEKQDEASLVNNYQANEHDPVSWLIGGNPSNGGTNSQNATGVIGFFVNIYENLKVLVGDNTSHNSYGDCGLNNNKQQVCRDYWQDSPERKAGFRKERWSRPVKPSFKFEDPKREWK